VRDSKPSNPAQVRVLERTREAGKKILMSGGSRCNVLPTDVDLATDFFTDSPRGALRAVFTRWDVWGCWSWLSDSDHVGLQLQLEESSSKWFPASNSSKDVRNALVAACECGPSADATTNAAKRAVQAMTARLLQTRGRAVQL